MKAELKEVKAQIVRLMIRATNPIMQQQGQTQPVIRVTADRMM
jgi:hypothetical protein